MNNLFKIYLALTTAYFISAAGNNYHENKFALKKPFQDWNSKNNTKNISVPATPLPKACRFVNIYIFNVTNPDNITEQIKPDLVQVGPYRYKISLVAPSDSKQRSYKYVKKYLFIQDKTTKNESDRVNILNIPYIRLVQAIARAGETYRSNGSEIQKIMAAINSSIILEGVTVAEIVTEGIDVNGLFQKLQNVNTSILEYPKELDGGIYYAFPEEIDVEIFKSEGAKRVYNIESIAKEKYELGCWKDRKCNSINGTDGLVLDKPFGTIFNKTRLLSIFYPDLYRSVKLNFSDEINDVYVYVLASDLFQGSTSHKNNCFCAHPNCFLMPGAFDVSQCKNGFPLVYSLPHFLNADENYSKKFNGLRAKKGEHESFYRIDPVTGELLFQIRRLQQNIWLKSVVSSLNNSDYVYKSKGLENVIFPFLWTEETYELMERTERKNKSSNPGSPAPKNNSFCHCACDSSKNTSADYFHFPSIVYWLSIALPFLLFTTNWISIG